MALELFLQNFFRFSSDIAHRRNARVAVDWLMGETTIDIAIIGRLPKAINKVAVNGLKKVLIVLAVINRALK